MIGKLKLIIICLSVFPLTLAQDCQIDLLANPTASPLLLTVLDGTYSFPDPTSTDNRTLDLLSNQELVFACPGGQFTQPGLNTRGQHAFCQGGTTLSSNSFLYDYNILNCTLTDLTRPALADSYDDPSLLCENSERPVRVGYKIDGTLVPVLDVCFNEATALATYTRHRLTGFAPLAQSTARSPPTYFQFYLSLYNKDVQSVYDSFEFYFEKLGLEEYLTDAYFLRAGHLAPYEDFFHPFQRDAAYHYVNAAPQWNTFDDGNWRVLEDGVLQVVANGKMGDGVVVTGDATVVTGTLKVGTLVSNATGTPEVVELILRYGQFPIPRWFWKVVYFGEVDIGAVFFGFNNPYAGLKDEVDAEFVAEICSEDVFESLRAKWYLDHVDNSGPGLGYMFACSLDLGGLLDPTINSVVTNVLSK
ncbi:uncharacterized protein LOC135125974 [Zophobas morio]